uniref:Kazal-like domain-containing protein n=1 Tax=Buteo japonicus TaxID=224669 RepID=A0A8C0B2J6_9AVES
TRKLPTPGGRLSCTRENDPVRDSSGKQHINKCLMCAEKLRSVWWNCPAQQTARFREYKPGEMELGACPELRGRGW